MTNVTVLPEIPNPGLMPDDITNIQLNMLCEFRKWTILFDQNTSRLANIDAEIGAISTNIAQIRMDIDVLTALGSDYNRGIAVHNVHSMYDLSRAMAVVALRNSNQFNDVVKEVSAPTPIPGAT